MDEESDEQQQQHNAPQRNPAKNWRASRDFVPRLGALVCGMTPRALSSVDRHLGWTPHALVVSPRLLSPNNPAWSTLGTDASIPAPDTNNIDTRELGKASSMAPPSTAASAAVAAATATVAAAAAAGRARVASAAVIALRQPLRRQLTTGAAAPSHRRLLTVAAPLASQAARPCGLPQPRGLASSSTTTSSSSTSQQQPHHEAPCCGVPGCQHQQPHTHGKDGACVKGRGWACMG